MIEITKDGDHAIVRPQCDIVASVIEEVKDVFKQQLNEGCAGITVDLAGVSMIDSMGLGVLIAAHNSLQKKDARLGLTNPSKDIMKLLKNMRLDQHFKID